MGEEIVDDYSQQKQDLREYLGMLGVSVKFKTRTSRTGWKTLFAVLSHPELYSVRERNHHFHAGFKEIFPDYFGVTSSCRDECTVRLTLSESEAEEKITKKIETI